MNERTKVEIPVRWALGVPEEWERVAVADHIGENGEVQYFEVGESGCYGLEAIEATIESGVNHCDDACRMDYADVVAVVYRYHDWIEVLVLEDRASGDEVAAQLVMGNEVFYGENLADIEPEVVRAMTRWAFISELSM